MNNSACGQTPAPRPPYGFESAANRIADKTDRIGDQIARLATLLNPVLEVLAPKPCADVAKEPYANDCELHQVLNERAYALESLADRLESLIHRIRL
jgi:hypothetical protein